MKKIYVGNLPYSVNEDDLKSFFGDCGNVEEVSLIKDRATGRLKGFGFVEFESKDGADAALEKNGEKLQDRELKISIAKERTSSDRDRGGSRGGRGGY